MKWLYALILPVMIHLAVIISINYDSSILGAAIGFADGVLFFTGGWTLVVLLPTSLTQLLCSCAMQRADCHHYQRFLVGLLNPSIAIFSLIVVGLLGDGIFSSNS